MNATAPHPLRPAVRAFAWAVAVLPMLGVPTVAAADGLVVVVSAESPVTSVPRRHLADLFLGRTSRFPNGDPAEPIDQDAGSPARKAFYADYVGRSLAEVKAHWSKIIFTGRGRPPVAVANGAQVKDLIAGNPRAIGYLDSRLVDASVRVVRVE